MTPSEFYSTEFYQSLRRDYMDDLHLTWLASYKGPPRSLTHKMTHAVTTTVTRSIYSHCEIYIPNYGCVTSSQRDGGVRKKQVNVHDGKWDLLPLPWVPAVQVIRFFFDTIGEPYDFWGLHIFLRDLGLPNSDGKWWCSEWCATACKVPDTLVSPGRLEWVLRQKLLEWEGKRHVRK